MSLLLRNSHSNEDEGQDMGDKWWCDGGLQRVLWEHVRMVPGKSFERRENPVLMRKSRTSKASHWKTLVLPCEFMVQNEVIETQHSEKRQKYLNTALWPLVPLYPAPPPPFFLTHLISWWQWHNIKKQKDLSSNPGSAICCLCDQGKV